MSVVVGYVPDATGLLAIQQATLEAGWRGTEVVIVNVVGVGGYTRPTAADEKELDAITARLAKSGVPFSVRHIETPTAIASESILAIAEETQAELIVVGVKRRSAIAKAVLGSTAQRVLLGAHCPVLSVRADED